MLQLLYVGLNCPSNTLGRNLSHFPLIEIVPRPSTETAIQAALQPRLPFTHQLFTSQTAVQLWWNLKQGNPSLPTFAVGKKTAVLLQKLGVVSPLVATLETAEGVIDLLQKKLPQRSHLLWPHAAASRPVIENFLRQQKIIHTTPILYDTYPVPRVSSQPDWLKLDGVVFTSPSTVHSFSHHFGLPAKHLKLFAIGPITAQTVAESFALEFTQVIPFS